MFSICNVDITAVAIWLFLVFHKNVSSPFPKIYSHYLRFIFIVYFSCARGSGSRDDYKWGSTSCGLHAPWTRGYDCGCTRVRGSPGTRCNWYHHPFIPGKFMVQSFLRSLRSPKGGQWFKNCEFGYEIVFLKCPFLPDSSLISHATISENLV